MSNPAPSRTLDDWLALLEKRHPVAIELGLERVAKVASRLLQAERPPVITVAGTNGKGSVVATLKTLANTHQLRAGVYTSPHILRFSERIEIDSHVVDDAELVRAFEAVEAARADISLTYFEFTTLAAFWLFEQQSLDLWILEVGMGGRLDAVNIIDADVAVVTTIDFDHMAFLGDTLEAIAAEKAGICRAGKPVVLADPDRRELLLAAVQPHDAKAFAVGRDYQFALNDGRFRFSAGAFDLRAAEPQLGADLVAAALMAFRLAFPSRIESDACRQAVEQAALAGRWQQIASNPPCWVDIGHNPQASKRLAERAKAAGFTRWHVVIGMLADKDIVGVLKPWFGIPCAWYLCDLSGPRAATAQQLRSVLPDTLEARCFDSPNDALQAAKAATADGEAILVFGSFLTVAAVLAQ